MKKILAIFLALITILSVTLVACNDNKGTTGGNYNNDNDDTDDEFVVRKDNTTDTGDTTTTDTGKNTEQGAFVTPSVSVVYAMWNINIRSTASSASSSNIVKTVDKATQLSVISQSTAVDKIDKPQWYKVSDGTTEGYVSGAWVTSNYNDTVFESCTPETLIIKNVGSSNYQVNIRTFPAVTDEDYHTITAQYTTSAGELKVIEKSKSGLWYKVEFTDNVKNGNNDWSGTYYIKMTSDIRGYFGLSTGSDSGAQG